MACADVQAGRNWRNSDHQIQRFPESD